jgi:transcriptional regulator with XRE-family HTH domain
LSSLEHGLVMPTVATLAALAEGLGVRLLDLVTFPAEDDHQALVDALRKLPKGTIRKLLKDCHSPPTRTKALK